MNKEDDSSKHNQWAVKEKAKDLLKTGKKKIEDIDLNPIWKKTKEELQSAAKVIGKGTEKAAEKTVSFGKKAGFQSQVYVNQLKRQKGFVELGERIYDLMRHNSPALVLDDTKALKMIKKIMETDKETQGLKKKVKSSKK